MSEMTQREDEIRSVAPAVDVFEGESGFLVVADLPGVSEEGLTVEIDHERLAITGRRDDGKLEFHRSFSVPRDTDAANVSAGLRDGVLTVTLPRHERALPRRIQLQQG